MQWQPQRHRIAPAPPETRAGALHFEGAELALAALDGLRRRLGKILGNLRNAWWA